MANLFLQWILANNYFVILVKCSKHSALVQMHSKFFKSTFMIQNKFVNTFYRYQTTQIFKAEFKFFHIGFKKLQAIIVTKYFWVFSVLHVFSTCLANYFFWIIFMLSGKSNIRFLLTSMKNTYHFVKSFLKILRSMLRFLRLSFQGLWQLLAYVWYLIAFISTSSHSYFSMYLLECCYISAYAFMFFEQYSVILASKC